MFVDTPTIKPSHEENSPGKAGSLASDKILFGECSRYAVYAVHTRFNKVMWFVDDADQKGEDGFAKTIRQDFDFYTALSPWLNMRRAA